MAYPVIAAPYGFKPVNLIGGQVFAGQIRQYPIQYGYATSIFNGDFVNLIRGTVNRQIVTTGASTTTGGAGGGMVGVFLGCSYTDPVTKQKRYSQYWPASTLAGDAVAFVSDDPDTIFKAAVVTTQGGTTIGGVSIAVIGQNMQGSDLSGNINNGDSSNGVLSSATTNTAAFPFRVIDVVRETAYSVTGTGSSTGTTITLTAGLPSPLPLGADVAYLAANGQLVETGSFVSAAYTSGTSVTINAAIAVPGSVIAIPASSTIVFTVYPEVLVKINFGNHAYYNATPL